MGIASLNPSYELPAFFASGDADAGVPQAAQNLARGVRNSLPQDEQGGPYRLSLWCQSALMLVSRKPVILKYRSNAPSPYACIFASRMLPPLIWRYACMSRIPRVRRGNTSSHSPSSSMGTSIWHLQQ